MGQVEMMSDEQRVVTALALVVSAGHDLMDIFGSYLNATSTLEDWLQAGADADVETAQAISGDVKQAVAALTTLGTLCLRIAGGAARAAGMQPDPAVN